MVQGMLVDANVIGMWRMPRTGTLVTDEASTPHNLTLISAAAPRVPGPIDTAVNVTTNYYSNYTTVLGALATGLTGAAYTIEAWIYLNSNFTTLSTIFHFGGNGETQALNDLARFYVNANRTLGFSWEHGVGVDDIITSDTTVLTMGIWYHVAFVRNGLNCAYYINGVKKTTPVATNPPDGGTSGTINIGRTDNATTAMFAGAIEEVRISNIARSDAEILTSYQRVALQGSDGSATDLKKNYTSPPSHRKLATVGTLTPANKVGGGGGVGKAFNPGFN